MLIAGMFETFLASLMLDPGPAEDGWHDQELDRVAGYLDLIGRFAGRSFEGGLYRLHSSVSGPLGQRLLAASFPEYAKSCRVFGMDWLGRQSAVDLDRVIGGQPQVVVFEPGTGEALEIPASFESFHEEEIVNFADAALAVDFYNEWRLAVGWGTNVLKASQCVGYKIPLFLGGRDDLSNLEVCDVEVYWDFCGQLRAQARIGAIGTEVRSVRRDAD